MNCRKILLLALALLLLATLTAHAIVPSSTIWPNANDFFWLNGGVYISSPTKICFMGPRVESGTLKHLGDLSIAYAPNPWGAFGSSTTLYAPPDKNPDLLANEGCWWYTGKCHPELSLSGEALCSYCVNAWKDSGGVGLDNADSADIYRPHFVRLRTIQ